jgi:NADPH-dependent 2,4-dienoyl-CoA reductase/sulfur reductase-like enzyme
LRDRHLRRRLFVSFANCCPPYCVGDVIQEEKNLIVVSQELFKKRFDIRVRTESEVLSIDREVELPRIGGPHHRYEWKKAA